MRQDQQQILPPPLPVTTVWSYGSVNHPGSFNHPALTVEAKWTQSVRVNWLNDLKVLVTGNFLAHILPVAPTFYWASLKAGIDG